MSLYILCFKASPSLKLANTKLLAEVYLKIDLLWKCCHLLPTSSFVYLFEVLLHGGFSVSFASCKFEAVLTFLEVHFVHFGKRWPQAVLWCKPNSWPPTPPYWCSCHAPKKWMRNRVKQIYTCMYLGWFWYIALIILSDAPFLSFVTPFDTSEWETGQ